MSSAAAPEPRNTLFTVLAGDVAICMLTARNEAEALLIATLLNGVQATGTRAPTHAELEAFWTWRRGFSHSQDVKPLAMPLQDVRR